MTLFTSKGTVGTMSRDDSDLGSLVVHDPVEIEPSARPSLPRRRRFVERMPSIGLALFAAIGLWYLVHHRSYVASAVRIAAAAPPRDWVLAFGASVALAVATGGVYRECLRTAGVEVPLGRAIRLSLASHFFNCAVPGGKLSSVVLFTAEADRRADAPASGAAGFFTASVIGRVGLTIVALVTLPLTARMGMASLAVVGLVGAYTAITVVRIGVFALLERRHRRLVDVELRVRSCLNRMIDGVRCDADATWAACASDQWSRRAKFVPAIVWSLGAKLAGGYLVMVGVHAAGGSVSFTVALAIYAIATVAGSLSMLPVGLGVVELTMMHTLTGSGLTIAQGAAALMLYRLFQMWAPMLAGAICLIGLRRSSTTNVPAIPVCDDVALELPPVLGVVPNPPIWLGLSVTAADEVV